MEKRSASRAPTYLRAEAVCQPEDSPVKCLIVDVSETGAKLQFSDGEMKTLPDRFQLLVVKTGEQPFVRVAWRNANQLGVTFESDSGAPSDPPLESGDLPSS